MNTQKKTAFGIIGASAAALITLGLAAPAMASTHDTTNSSYDSRSHSSVSKSYEQMSERVTEILNGNTSNTPLVVSPQLNLGDVASGNAVGSGDSLTAPVLSGNESAIASGNQNSVGNGTSVLNGSGNGNSVSSSVSDLVTSTTGNISSDVSGMVSDITGSLGLSSH